MAKYADTLRKRSDDMREAMYSDVRMMAFVDDGPSLIYDLEKVSKNLTNTLIYPRDEYDLD